MISGFSKYAIQCHKDTNHLYDGYLPYEYHLRMTVANAHRFIHLVHKEGTTITPRILCACWGHDLIEDTRQNYSSIYETAREIYMNNYIPTSYRGVDLPKEIVEIIYAVSNEKGRNRRERESDRYFQGIKDTPYATFVKLCDRIANIEYSKLTQSDKLKMYREEHVYFTERLYDETYKEMFYHMESLLKTMNNGNHI